ncbi:DUF805 domain-containing protein [Candidatus Falkowbacteria bacterium CG10_big_fil_rev_8_21_14_0_10_37_14]|uniref:DUF805 domain-containing protein n=1 Tax=Candidatus Falkowbacteria bacterium CG10_big_fil_rev_8_21_14_0_10_37_14 TaxID=1974561 RepID=A0A2M6WTL2_9BACT|nr:DUF805 domain-containing protein [Candidatus Falkowbacteria bacterium]PIT96091.1 MAG: DUF805 domain-containing protein [Candidatus Falkowbacteria bacterium CG10_big_fil_rev_8_21_14_0_10_37_14]
MYWFLKCWRLYAVFKGRANRSEFWIFVLFEVVIGFLLAYLAFTMGDVVSPLLFSYLFAGFQLISLLPMLAVSARRLHDTGRSGWWWLVNLVPLVGFIIFLVFCIEKSQPMANQYGAVPSSTE